MRRLAAFALLSALVLTGMSCGDKTPVGPSGPGDLQVRLTSPNSGLDSAIVLTITGPAPLTSATAGPGLRLFQPAALSGTTTRFALVGQLTNGAVIMTIGVQDLAVLSQYHGTIGGVAIPSYQLRQSLAGYALALTR